MLLNAFYSVVIRRFILFLWPLFNIIIYPMYMHYYDLFRYNIFYSFFKTNISDLGHLIYLVIHSIILILVKYVQQILNGLNISPIPF